MESEREGRWGGEESRGSRGRRGGQERLLFTDSSFCLKKSKEREVLK